MSQAFVFSLLKRRDPTEIPELRCGCGLPAVCRTARTARNPMRKFLSCEVCQLWIWEDLLNQFADGVVEYLQSDSIPIRDVPTLQCGCGRPVHFSVEPASSNKFAAPASLSFHCPICKLMIQENCIAQFIEDLIFYCQSATIDSLRAQLQKTQELISEKDKALASMEAELLKMQLFLDEHEHPEPARDELVVVRRTSWNSVMVIVVLVVIAYFFSR